MYGTPRDNPRRLCKQLVQLVQYDAAGMYVNHRTTLKDATDGDDWHMLRRDRKASTKPRAKIACSTISLSRAKKRGGGESETFRSPAQRDRQEKRLDPWAVRRGARFEAREASS